MRTRKSWTSKSPGAVVGAVVAAVAGGSLAARSMLAEDAKVMRRQIKVMRARVRALLTIELMGHLRPNESRIRPDHAIARILLAAEVDREHERLPAANVQIQIDRLVAAARVGVFEQRLSVQH